MEDNNKGVPVAVYSKVSDWISSNNFTSPYLGSPAGNAATGHSTMEDYKDIIVEERTDVVSLKNEKGPKSRKLSSKFPEYGNLMKNSVSQRSKSASPNRQIQVIFEGNENESDVSGEAKITPPPELPKRKVDTKSVQHRKPRKDDKKITTPTSVTKIPELKDFQEHQLQCPSSNSPEDGDEWRRLIKQVDNSTDVQSCFNGSPERKRQSKKKKHQEFRDFSRAYESLREESDSSPACDTVRQFREWKRRHNQKRGNEEFQDMVMGDDEWQLSRSGNDSGSEFQDFNEAYEWKREDTSNVETPRADSFQPLLYEEAFQSVSERGGDMTFQQVIEKAKDGVIQTVANLQNNIRHHLTTAFLLIVFDLFINPEAYGYERIFNFW